MKKSRDFCERILGQKVEADYGTIVLCENRFAIHDGAALSRTVFGVRCHDQDGHIVEIGEAMYLESLKRVVQ